jgi:hypothetical protein
MVVLLMEVSLLELFDNVSCAKLNEDINRLKNKVRYIIFFPFISAILLFGSKLFNL